MAAAFLHFMQTFASLLRASRALLGRDQEVVASWVGLDRREVGAWEAGKYKLMSRAGIDLRKAMERNGIEFIDPTADHGAGVRCRNPSKSDPLRSAQYRAARAMVNLSQRAMADYSGVNRNFIARLEANEMTGVNLEALRALDEAYVRLNVEMVVETLSTGFGVQWRGTSLKD